MKFFKKILYVAAALVMIITCLAGGCNCSSCEKAPDPKYSEGDTYYLYEDYSYGEEKIRNLYDLALPKNKQGDCSLIMYIHGGAWITGEKGGGLGLTGRCKDGIASCAINYRYIDKKTDCFDIMDDIKNALSAMKVIASEKGINLTKLMLTGGSAGGHLAVQYAYTMAEVSPIRPVFAVTESGPSDMTDAYYFDKDGKYYDNYIEWFGYLSGNKLRPKKLNDAIPSLKAVSPAWVAKSNSVPTIICHGVNDDIVPISNADTLDRVLTELGVKHDYFVFRDSGHGLENDPETRERYNAKLNEYILDYLT